VSCSIANLTGNAPAGHSEQEEATHLANVLCVGINDAMMRKRQSILERAGHSVTQATDLRRVIAVCERNRFAVAVLGPFLHQPEKLRVTCCTQALFGREDS
jgi:PleD family two-component response regulator